MAGDQERQAVARGFVLLPQIPGELRPGIGLVVVETRFLKLQPDIVLHAPYRLDSPLGPPQKRFPGIVPRLPRRVPGVA